MIKEPTAIHFDHNDNFEEILTFLLHDNELTGQDFGKETPYEYKNRKVCTILESILDLIDRPIVAVIEPTYIDEEYLEMYSKYHVFSHKQNSKFSRRIILFEDCFGNDFYNTWFPKNISEIENSIIGVFVIPYSASTYVFNAYISPRILVGKLNEEIVLSKVDLHIYGRKVKMYFFPFRQTDSQYIACAEISVSGINDFYNHLNKGFGSVRISDVLKYKEDLAQYGGNKSYGMSSKQMIGYFQKKGFQVEVFEKAVWEDNFSGVSAERILIRNVSPYIESGYPCILLAESPDNDYSMGHCVNGIGIVRNMDFDWEDIVCYKQDITPDLSYYTVFEPDFCSHITTIDDYSCIKRIKIEPDEKKAPDDYCIDGAIVVLPPEIKLSSMDASSIAETLLGALNISGAEQTPSTWIIKIILADAIDFIEKRVMLTDNLEEKAIYSSLDLPKYVWVCELYTKENYSAGLVDVEILLDATNSFVDVENTVFAIRYQNSFAFDLFENKDWDFFEIEGVKKHFKRYIPPNVFTSII